MARILGIFISAAFVAGALGQGCVFPSFLQMNNHPNRRWMWHVANQGGSAPDIDFCIVTFIDDVMDVDKESAKPDPTGMAYPYRRHCIARGEHGLVASHEYSEVSEAGNRSESRTRYSCIQFKEISPYVVLVSQSSLADANSSDLCDDNLTADYWPLVSFRVQTELLVQHVPPTFFGGYHLSMVSSTGTTVCAMDSLDPSRLEVACTSDMEITFTFGSSCLHTDVTDRQSVFVDSLGYWSLPDYTFMVIKSIHLLDIWCLRLPANHSTTSFTAELFLDAVCDPELVLRNGSRYMRLDLMRIPYTSLCQDISSSCSNDTGVCNSDIVDAHATCLETCNKCSPLMLGMNDSCVFSEHLQGSWITASYARRGVVQVRRSRLYILGGEPYECLPTNWRLDSRYPLVYIGKDGCFPRFTCVEFREETPGFVTYRLASVRHWPNGLLGSDDPFQAFCEDADFDMTFDANTNRYKHTTPYGMVHDPRHGQLANKSVNCLIGNKNSTMITFQRLPQQTGRRCQGVFSVPCGDPKTIHIDQSECSPWPSELTTTYHCLASMTLADGRQLVVTVANDGDNVQLEDLDFRCWMFLANMKTLYVLPWADCDADEFNDMLGNDMYREQRQIFVINTLDQSVSSCQAETSTTTSTSTQTPFTVMIEEETTAYYDMDFIASAAPSVVNFVNVFCMTAFVFLFW